ncbi:MAG: GNAT family N-acetyltransferase [Anaerolineae bacterium]|jgi:ribosomal protein S18 acetylase RimI-like enzyme|nr:GNAT family N-acetyltransferase [Anaerolineae bacterium]
MNDSAAINIRPATRADLPFVAWCNYEASSPAPNFCYWDPLLEGLNTDTMDFIRAVFEEDALAWGKVEDFWLIELDGQVVGGASGFVMETQDYRPFRLDRLPAVAARLGWDAAALAQFSAGYEAVWSDPHDPTIAPSAPWVVECVAVKPEVRGRGLAKRLVGAILEAGRERGYQQAAISVTLGNEAAQRVYEAVGFRMYMTYGADYFGDAFPGTVKYRAHLS